MMLLPMYRSVLILALGLSPALATAQSFPRLTTAQAAILSNDAPMARPCEQDIDSLIQDGTWATFMHTCRGAPVGQNLIVHYNDGRWSVICGHGDDVLPAEMATAKRPGMTLADAIALHFPATDPNTQSVYDPVQVVTKYYLLWDRHRYVEMYHLLSPSYRNAHPYKEWLRSHTATEGIYGFAMRTYNKPLTTVPIAIMAVDRTPSGRSVRSSYHGTWTVVRSPDGSWKLDSVILQPGWV